MCCVLRCLHSVWAQGCSDCSMCFVCVVAKPCWFNVVWCVVVCFVLRCDVCFSFLLLFAFACCEKLCGVGMYGVVGDLLLCRSYGLDGIVDRFCYCDWVVLLVLSFVCLLYDLFEMGWGICGDDEFVFAVYVFVYPVFVVAVVLFLLCPVVFAIYDCLVHLCCSLV